MRLLVSVLCLVAVCATAPVHAGRMIYATAATPGRVDGFCLGSNGAIFPERRASIDTLGQYPRRILVSADNRILYVAENDRVEMFEVGPHGALRRAGQVPPGGGEIANPRDIALSADGRMLYYPQRPQNRILAFPLGEDGLPSTPDYTSCIRGPNPADWERLLVANGLLYVSASHGRGNVETFPLAPDGRFIKVCSDPENPQQPIRDPVTGVALQCGIIEPDLCERGNEPSAFSSRRTGLQGPSTMLLLGSRIFIEQKFRERIVAFDLQADGTFTPGDDSKENGEDRQPRVARTTARIRYTDLVLVEGGGGTSILGTQFFNGRVDGYRLKDGENLPRRPTRRTNENVFTSPVRLLVSGDVLYVGAGYRDRIDAYRLRDDGLPGDMAPFSQSEEQKGSFPNDMAIAEIPDACN